MMGPFGWLTVYPGEPQRGTNAKCNGLGGSSRVLPGDPGGASHAAPGEHERLSGHALRVTQGFCFFVATAGGRAPPALLARRCQRAPAQVGASKSATGQEGDPLLPKGALRLGAKHGQKGSNRGPSNRGFCSIHPTLVFDQLPPWTHGNEAKEGGGRGVCLERGERRLSG
jgi:hypothetical protein